MIHFYKNSLTFYKTSGYWNQITLLLEYVLIHITFNATYFSLHLDKWIKYTGTLKIHFTYYNLGIVITEA